jgi:hypothetical protein
MGTGVTGSGSCRVGTANVGDLINAHNPEGIDYQRKMCSGDTTTGLNRQIKEWTNPQNADIATVTMGGNDLGFSEIVKFCVIRFSFWSTGYVNKMCKQAKDKANAMMNDAGKDGIGYKLGAAYKAIVEKSTRDVSIRIYFSSFEIVSTDCVQSGLPSLRLWLSRWLFQCRGSTAYGLQAHPVRYPKHRVLPPKVHEVLELG